MRGAAVGREAIAIVGFQKILPRWRLADEVLQPLNLNGRSVCPGYKLFPILGGNADDPPFGVRVERLATAKIAHPCLRLGQTVKWCAEGNRRPPISY